MSKKFDLNIEEILENWEVFHAIREIIANAMDEELLTQTKEIEIFCDEGNKWHIRDFGRGIKYEHFTQNENIEKLENPNVIGKFGIGLKDAIATFDRNNVNVLIKSRYGDITFDKSEKHDFDDVITLHAIIEPPSESEFIGTEIILEGCSQQDINDAKNLFLRFSDDEILEQTKYGDVLEKVSKLAKIYVNGVKVAEEENFIFSYNVTSLTKSIRKALNRERTNVGRSAYSSRIKSILLSCKGKDTATILVNDLKNFQEGTLHDELNWTDVCVHSCKLLNSMKTVLFLTPDELAVTSVVNEARDIGHTICIIPNNVREKIKGTQDYEGNFIRDIERFIFESEEDFEFDFISEKDMTNTERKIFRMTDAILDLIGGKPRELKDIKISNTMRRETSSFTEPEWILERKKESIIIKRDQLQNLKIYSGSIFSSIACVVGGGPTGTPFEQELIDYLGNLAEKLLVNGKS